MPAMAQPIKPPTVQGNVIALYTQGESKRSIARTLGIARGTVDSILSRYGQDLSQVEPVKTTRLGRILPKAYDAVESAVTRGDAKIAMDLLKLEHSTRGNTTYNVAGDLSLSTASLLMPTITPSTASLPSTDVSTGTEAGAKPHGLEMGLSSRTNFSQFSDDELEQELARRRAARAPVLDAEVVR